MEVSPHEYGGQDHIRRVYGNQFVNPEVRVATPISDNVELRYTYTDAEGQEVTMNSSSPSGEVPHESADSAQQLPRRN